MKEECSGYFCFGFVEGRKEDEIYRIVKSAEITKQQFKPDKIRVLTGSSKLRKYSYISYAVIDNGREPSF